MERLNPPEHLSLTGRNLAMAWKKWRQRFEIYRVASGLTSQGDPVQTSVFLHSIGPEALDVYNTFVFGPEESKDKLEDVMKRFEEYFIPKRNVTYERHCFFMRNQLQGEAIDQYVTELRTLEKTCEFGVISESLVKDRLVCGVLESRLRERLLREMDLTLEKAVAICKASELSQFQLKELESGSTSTAGDLDAVRKGSKRTGDWQFIRDCPKCGRNHPERRCPAFTRNCLKCGLRGHFASKCKANEAQVQEMMMQEEQPAEMFISALGGSKSDVWSMSLRTNGIMVNFKLDTGAQVNVLPRSVYCRLTSKLVLEPAKIRLMPYGLSRPLPVDGQCLCQVEHGTTHHLQFYVVPATASPILGLNACQKLGLVKRIAEVDRNDNQIVKDVVLKDYSTVFGTPGLLRDHVYQIRLKEGAVPYSVFAPRRVKLPLLPKLRNELERMQKMGIIQEVVEPTDWIAPMVPVLKKNGQIRVCIDFSELNKSIRRERFQIPVAEEIFVKMHGSKCFTTLDAESGFWQIPLNESSSLLTTFITPFGRFRCLRLPFGITSGPEIFQRVMRQILAGIDGCDCFIDDIVVWGVNEEEHDQRLRRVLEKCKASGLKLNTSKCQLRKQEVKFFGHVLSNEGLKADPDKISAVTSLESPTNKDQLRTILGMSSYLAKFLPEFSPKAGPLRNLLREDTDWIWTAEHQNCLSDLKQMIVQAPVLAFYSAEAKTAVSVDASSYGLGAALLQIQSDRRKAPVMYASRTLTDQEKRFSQIEKEALALVWGCDRFESFLLGREEPFTIETDHKPLVTILNKQDLDQSPPRIQRFKMRMMKFNFQVVYVPG